METSQVGFFAQDELPLLSGDRAAGAQVRRMFRHLRAPARPAEFD